MKLLNMHFPTVYFEPNLQHWMKANSMGAHKIILHGICVLNWGFCLCQMSDSGSVLNINKAWCDFFFFKHILNMYF